MGRTNSRWLTAGALAVGLATAAMSVQAGASPRPDAAGGAVVVESAGGGLIGYFSASNAAPSATYGSGYSWYSSVWPAIDEPIANFQLGLGSSWLYPQLSGNTSHYCDHADSFVKGLGASDLQLFFQTIEGGLGYWTSTQFLSTMPKYRIGATPDCYQSQIASPGWNFGNLTGLNIDQTGIVQLSNHLLIPPDGLTFQFDRQAHLLGSAWLKVPLAPVRQAGLDAVATGNNFWTLFLNSTNFKGPVASIEPQRWADLSKIDPAIIGKGFDVAPMIKHPDMAAEIGQIPMFESSTGGQTYSRVPALDFPVDASKHTVITQDVRAYSDAAFVTAFNAWLAGGPTPPTVNPAGSSVLAFNSPAPSPNIKQGATTQQPVTRLDSQVTMNSFNSGLGFGFTWPTAAAGSTAQLPQYYVATGGTRTPTASPPAATQLAQQTFPQPALQQVTYSPPNPDWWGIEPGAPRGTATLTDGSTVTYAWVRFVDQPAIKRLGLTPTERANLQATIVRIHTTWPTNTDYIPSPSSGTLATLDPALLVTPPAGLTAGYVPIVLSQTGTNIGAGQATRLTPVVPERLLDTRADSQVGHTGPKPVAGQTISLQVVGAGATNVPATAQAVVLNVTATDATADGFVTVYPCGAQRPTASNLNLRTGDTAPNLVTVKLGAGGTVCLYTQSGTHLIADAAGWYPAAAAFTPVVPERVLDTRSGTQVGYTGAKPTAGQTVELKVTHVGAADIPDDARAVVVNVTATDATADGFVTVYPCGSQRPTASNLNLVANETRPNLVVVKVGTGGTICLFTQTGTHLIADIAGWYPAAAAFTPVVPERLLDTRSGTQVGYTGAKPTAGQTVTLQVTGVGTTNVPSGASLVVLNVTATAATAGGFVTVYPCGSARPTASNLNVLANETKPNLVTVKVGSNGTVCLFTQSGTHLIADIAGYGR